MKYTIFATLSLAVAASARPSFISAKRADFTLKNGQDAIALNDKFKTLTPDSACSTGDIACVNDKFAQCVGGKFVLQQCGGGLICAALPLVNSAGTSVTCTSAADRDSRIAATGAKDTSGDNSAAGGAAASSSAAVSSSAAASTAKAATASSTSKASSSSTKASSSSTAKAASSTKASTSSTVSSAAAASSSAAAGNNAAGGAAAGTSAQTSLTLDPKSIQPNYASDGNANPDAGQEPSLTSKNNFINFCLDFPNEPQTNGQQVIGGSCNQTPMGIIAAKTKMPSAKFQSPKNGDTVPANKNITITLAIKNIETGHFTNPATTFHMAPQQVNAQGLIKGHSHVVVEELTSLNQKTPTDPTKFKFFKGLNDIAKNGVLNAVIPGGLPKGFYRMASINSAANHQPALVAVAQRGALDDMIYFTVN